jgi:phosphatidylethanolamine/phosphatidyl-N-methylethanolamine N-methyltransferase
MPSDLGLFLRELLRNPKMISAIAPSSRWLARAMTASLRPGMRVVEFGPGTGVLTRAILATGVKPADLTLFEFNPDFTAHLRSSFPGTTVINDGAQTAATHCPPGVDAVISGLPLLSMPQDIREAIIAAAFAVLGPSGTYIQFTYGPRPPISDQQIAALGLTVTQTAHIWLNLPPARVFRFSST